MPPNAESLYLLKNGIKKNETTAEQDMPNAIHNIPG